MNIIHLLTGIRSSVLIRMLVRNHVSFHPGNLIRLWVLFQNALFSSVLTRVERKKFSKIAEDIAINKPPVFIIGHWRTGSTYLHQLMNLDPQFTTPSLVQTVIPDHFLFSTKYYVPIMKRLMPKKRPMDEVAISPYEPQEDEFALIRLGSVSPLEKLIFPEKGKYFLVDFGEYIPEGEKLKVWKQNLLTFYRKITWLTGKQIVTKNPFHTMRIGLLANMFPGARFIHICRHPFEVIPSTIRMWNTVSAGNSLNRRWKKPDIIEVASVLRSFNDQVSVERQKLSDHCFTEVRFEDLEKDPVKALKQIYAELDLEYSAIIEKEVNIFLEKNRNYKKNLYHLSKEEQDLILSCLAGSANSHATG